MGVAARGVKGCTCPVCQHAGKHASHIRTVLPTLFYRGSYSKHLWAGMHRLHREIYTLAQRSSQQQPRLQPLLVPLLLPLIEIDQKPLPPGGIQHQGCDTT
jgi:hypothetical protein